MLPKEALSNSSRNMLMSAWEVLSPQELLAIDWRCDRFEKAYLENAQTKIEDHIIDLPSDQRALVAAELIEVEWTIRRDRGECPSEAEYIDRFPDLKETIGYVADVHESVALSTASTKPSTFSATMSLANSFERTTQLNEPGFAEPILAAPRHHESIDRCLGHFEICDEIGRGGMGVVYRAKDKKLDREVALKSLTRTAFLQPQACERFLREAKAAAVVRHPNVVTIYSVEVIDNVPFIVMELVDGVTLEAYLRKHGPMRPRDVAMLGAQLASGLAAAHQKGLIHRDVKPANILLESCGSRGADKEHEPVIHAKITDFGLARAASEMSLTDIGVIVGTPQFMSPEQASGEPADHRSDLFSLGSVLYAACTGKPAFTAETIPGILHKVIGLPAEPLTNLNPLVSVELSDLIARLMSKSPDDRIQTASEAATCFNEIATLCFQDSHPVPLTLPKSSDHWAKWLGVGAVALTVLLGLVLLRTSDGEFILRTEDPQIAAMLGPNELSMKSSPLFNPDCHWSTPIGLDSRINTEADETHPTLSGDGLVLIFLRDSKAYQSTRIKSGRAFRLPILLPGPLNDEGDVDSPYLTQDGLTLVFASARSGSQGENDLWISHRSSIDASFSQPVNLGLEVNTIHEESTPSLSPDALTLWFCTDRPNVSQQVDLYQATRQSTDQPFSNAVRLQGRVNGPGNDFFPRPAFADLVLLYTVTDQNGQQAYFSARKNLAMPFGNPRPLVFDSDKHIVGTVTSTADGHVFVYDSDRPDGKGGFDLWLVRSMPWSRDQQSNPHP